MAKNLKPPATTHSGKALTSIQGDDEFSVFSVDPELKKPKMDLGLRAEEKSVATPLSRSVVRLFRKIFGE
jgi:hypothetical protein